MNLREYIDTSGVRQSVLAEKASCSQALISQICTGKRRPSPDIAKSISEATGGKVTAMELLYPNDEAA